MRKFFAIVVAFFCFSAVYAQAPALRINHIALAVRNLDQSAAFYQRVFHLQEITNKGQTAGIRWFSLGDGKELHLIEVPDVDLKLNKSTHLAFSTDAFDKFLVQLQGQAINYADWVGTVKQVNLRADGVKQVYFQDPDGYWIEVNSAASH